jgi:hypothetical protein
MPANLPDRGHGLLLQLCAQFLTAGALSPMTNYLITPDGVYFAGLYQPRRHSPNNSHRLGACYDHPRH